MRLRRFFFMLPAVYITLTSSWAHAYFQQELMAAKRKQKASSRWTLADWLAQKNQMAFWDQWLAMNRSVPYFDLSLSGARTVYDLKTLTPSQSTIDRYASHIFEVDLSIFFLNLIVEYEDMNHDRKAKAAACGIRWFGTSSQSTSLNTRYGVREWEDELTREQSSTPFAEGQLQIYVTGFLGVKGRYRKLFEDTTNQSRKVKGDRASYGVFAEAIIFRAYVEYFTEQFDFDPGGQFQRETREGYDGGLKIFF